MKEIKENFRWLGKFYRPIRKRLYLIAAQSVLVAMLTALIPFVYMRIIDSLKDNLSGSFLTKTIAVLFGLGVLNFLASVTNATRRAQTNIELEWKFRQHIFDHLIKLDQRFYGKFWIGDIVTRLTDDVGRKLSWFACSGVFRAWESLLRVGFSLAAMAMLNPLLTLVALAPFPIQIFIFVKTGTILDSRFKRLQGLISRVNDMVESCFSGIRIVQAYGKERRQAEEFAKAADERARGEVSAEKTHLFVHSLYGYFWQIAQVLVLLAGGWMVIQQRLTVGEFVAFNYYISYLIWPMFDVAGLLLGYRRAAVSIKRLRELESYQPAIFPPEQPLMPENGAGHIEFRNVTFKVNDKTVLDNISFDAGAARMIAVVGEVGAGKSMLLSLLCRFFDPDQGEIQLDHIPLPQWNLAELRARVGYVSQEPLLFTETVKNNVRFGREGINDGAIAWAADLAQLTNEVKGFSQGIDTKIGLRGMTVSGGQKQRISIARALAGKPRVLVLDDATAHLDAETESELWNQLYLVIPNMRTFYVSHRTATLEQADLILVLKEGRLVERGVHDQLMAERGEYFRIYAKQKLEELVRK